MMSCLIFKSLSHFEFIFVHGVRGWEKMCHANGPDKKAGVAILISDKIDLKTKAIKKDKEGHYSQQPTATN